MSILPVSGTLLTSFVIVTVTVVVSVTVAILVQACWTKAEDSAPNSFPSDKVVPKEGTLEQKQTSSIRQGIRVDHQK